MKRKENKRNKKKIQNNNIGLQSNCEMDERKKKNENQNKKKGKKNPLHESSSDWPDKKANIEFKTHNHKWLVR